MIKWQRKVSALLSISYDSFNSPPPPEKNIPKAATD